ncbi:type I-E CRISPR-associated protein Cas6/Cse3/CasE [Actinopolyspora erythraea]|uniref:CRISPR-associated protein Cse3 n=1 Tax=Actinopolyspora erythraea TaxID=414996 RepID=A0A099D346_9ACTN|nr:type I-E CRISPR-associated protein Cas6/Cse3/CasE [Actinopolyspora erythraea]ASU77288.1 type I-E CRISPR-associated protein Cas6/Cse3/CasE [Actinopolyspora erythraea]KGI80227.1 CRISPR-associated protein Cse3 [Actinopolyspora erythraea]
MFLTKMPLNPRRRGARKLLGSPQALHAAVQAGFADPSPTEEGRVLWRLDTYGQHRVVLYTVSPDKPDFTHLVEQAGWPTTETWQTRDYDPLLDSLRMGQRWQFRLTANPVRSARHKEWTETKPLAHVTVKQQKQWLLDRTTRLGFQLVTSDSASEAEPDLTIVERGTRRFNRQGSDLVTISTATFEGQLEVAEPMALRHALTFGIGRAKAYGCGLLTLAPSLRKGAG